ncbi:hypothetical protein [Paenibacillus medicaginis]|uniref:Uncharacterized protein n=1 Tax=Paenibacillus medicaginis TaxID=1470560 RepID=A0ABV5BUS9_9BACL
MKQYFVYTNEPELLNPFGDVYIPKLKMSFVVLTSELDITDVWNLPGVYEAKECEKGTLSV